MKPWLNTGLQRLATSAPAIEPMVLLPREQNDRCGLDEAEWVSASLSNHKIPQKGLR
jgi:hypothetical protein